jgi:hypothetical protein
LPAEVVVQLQEYLLLQISQLWEESLQTNYFDFTLLAGNCFFHAEKITEAYMVLVKHMYSLSHVNRLKYQVLFADTERMLLEKTPVEIRNEMTKLFDETHTEVFAIGNLLNEIHETLEESNPKFGILVNLAMHLGLNKPISLSNAHIASSILVLAKSGAFHILKDFLRYMEDDEERALIIAIAIMSAALGNQKATIEMLLDYKPHRETLGNCIILLTGESLKQEQPILLEIIDLLLSHLTRAEATVFLQNAQSIDARLAAFLEKRLHILRDRAK